MRANGRNNSFTTGITTAQESSCESRYRAPDGNREVITLRIGSTK